MPPINPYDSASVSRRTVVKAAVAAGASGLLAGCIGSSDSGSDSNELITEQRLGSSSASNELTYWALKAHSHLVDNEEFASTIEDDFYRPWAENHEDYRIDYELQTSYSEFETNLAQVVSADNAPDISITDSVWVPNYYEDLQPVTEGVPDEDDWFPFVKDVAKQNDDWVTVWQNTDCRVLYYREDLIQEYGDGSAPETWDEVIEVGQAIAENENMAGLVFNGGRWEGTTFDNLAYYWGQGGDILDENRDLAIDQGDNRDRLLNVFEFFERTVDTGVTPTRVANFDDYSMLTQEAVNGDAAMFIGGNWQIAQIREQVDDWEQWQVAEIPQVEAGMSASGAGGWTQSIFTTDDSLQSAARDFVTRVAEKDLMAAYTQAGGYLPTRPSVFEEYDYFSEDPYQQKFADILENARARPGGPKYNAFSGQFQIRASEVLTGQSSPDEAVDQLIENVRAEVDE